jgi:hypothetical protein
MRAQDAWMSNPSSTEQWAATLGIPIGEIPPPIPEGTRAPAYSAREVAKRALVLQGVVAVASGVPSDGIIEWFEAEGLWLGASPREKEFLVSCRSRSVVDEKVRWRQEAEWTLLWVVGQVASLGLPTRGCDTRRLVDEIIPPLGDSVEQFLSSAVLRPNAELLAEDDRTYNLWCYAMSARSAGAALPGDLNLTILYQRRYAFEWLDGIEEWDFVSCDA